MNAAMTGAGAVTYEAVAVRYWQAGGEPVLSHLAAGTQRACEDVARRCSIGSTEWPATAVRPAGGGQACCWWVAGQIADEPPVPPPAPRLPGGSRGGAARVITALLVIGGVLAVFLLAGHR